MADLIDRQAAIDMFQRQAYDDWNQGAGTTWANAFSEAADMIEDLPTADAVEVVRCKDCYHYDEEDEYCIFNDREMKLLDFCSYGDK